MDSIEVIGVSIALILIALVVVFIDLHVRKLEVRKLEERLIRNEMNRHASTDSLSRQLSSLQGDVSALECKVNNYVETEAYTLEVTNKHGTKTRYKDVVKHVVGSNFIIDNNDNHLFKAYRKGDAEDDPSVVIDQDDIKIIEKLVD